MTFHLMNRLTLFNHKISLTVSSAGIVTSQSQSGTNINPFTVNDIMLVRLASREQNRIMDPLGLTHRLDPKVDSFDCTEVHQKLSESIKIRSARCNSIRYIYTYGNLPKSTTF